MSTLAQLKTVVYGYLQTSFPSVVRHPLLANGTAVEFEKLLDTLFVQAADNARKHAELLHDFQCAECKLEGTIPTTGLGLSWDSLLDENDAVASLRAIESAYVVNETTGDLTEVSIKRKKFLTKLKYDQRQRRTRYHQTEDLPTIIHHQRKFYCDPLNDLPVDLVIDGYRWLTNYATLGLENIVNVTGTFYPVATGTYLQQTTLNNTRPWYAIGAFEFVSGNAYPTTTSESSVIYWTGSVWFILYFPLGINSSQPVQGWFSTEDVATPNLVTAWAGIIGATGSPVVSAAIPTYIPIEFSTITDYFLLHGFAYMQWATIVELNHLIQRFVQRQEGSLSPPTKERDVQLQLLINNDCFASESGDYHDIRND